jgi:hypothetical protein
MKFPEIDEKLITMCSKVLKVPLSDVHKSMWKKGKQLADRITPPLEMDTVSLEEYYNEIIDSVVYTRIFNDTKEFIKKSIDDYFIYDSGIVIQTRTTKKEILLKDKYVHYYISKILESVSEIYNDVFLFTIHDDYNEKNPYTMVNFHNIRNHHVNIEEIDNYDGTTTFLFDFHIMPLIEY